MAGATATLDLGTLLRKRIQVIGTVLRSRPLEEKMSLARDVSRSVLPLLASGRVHPVIESVHSFADIAEAHRRMESNDTFGKIVLVW
jgi:NADPH:quinone reductase